MISVLLCFPANNFVFETLQKKKAASTTNLAMGARHQFVLENLQKKQIARSKTNLAVRAEHQSILEVLKQKKK